MPKRSKTIDEWYKEAIEIAKALQGRKEENIASKTRAFVGRMADWATGGIDREEKLRSLGEALGYIVKILQGDKAVEFTKKGSGWLTQKEGSIRQEIPPEIWRLLAQRVSQFFGGKKLESFRHGFYIVFGQKMLEAWDEVYQDKNATEESRETVLNVWKDFEKDAPEPIASKVRYRLLLHYASKNDGEQIRILLGQMQESLQQKRVMLSDFPLLTMKMSGKQKIYIAAVISADNNLKEVFQQLNTYPSDTRDIQTLLGGMKSEQVNKVKQKQKEDLERLQSGFRTDFDTTLQDQKNAIDAINREMSDYIKRLEALGYTDYSVLMNFFQVERIALFNGEYGRCKAHLPDKAEQLSLSAETVSSLSEKVQEEEKNNKVLMNAILLGHRLIPDAKKLVIYLEGEVIRNEKTQKHLETLRREMQNKVLQDVRGLMMTAGDHQAVSAFDAAMARLNASIEEVAELSKQAVKYEEGKVDSLSQGILDRRKIVSARIHELAAYEKALIDAGKRWIKLNKEEKALSVSLRQKEADFSSVTMALDGLQSKMSKMQETITGLAEQMDQTQKDNQDEIKRLSEEIGEKQAAIEEDKKAFSALIEEEYFKRYQKNCGGLAGGRSCENLEEFKKMVSEDLGTPRLIVLVKELGGWMWAGMSRPFRQRGVSEDEVAASPQKPDKEKWLNWFWGRVEQSEWLQRIPLLAKHQEKREAWKAAVRNAKDFSQMDGDMMHYESQETFLQAFHLSDLSNTSPIGKKFDALKEDTTSLAKMEEELEKVRGQDISEIERKRGKIQVSLEGKREDEESLQEKKKALTAGKEKHQQELRKIREEMATIQSQFSQTLEIPLPLLAQPQAVRPALTV